MNIDRLTWDIKTIRKTYIMNVVNNSPELKYLTNSAGCVWNGPTMGGRWICPMRNISLNHYE